MWDKARNKKNGYSSNASISSTPSSNSYSSNQPTYQPTQQTYTPTYQSSGVSCSDVKSAIGYITTKYVGWPNMASSYVSNIFVTEPYDDEFRITVEIVVIMMTKLDSDDKAYKFERELQSTVNDYAEEVEERLDSFAQKHCIDFEVEVKVSKIS